MLFVPQPVDFSTRVSSKRARCPACSLHRIMPRSRRMFDHLVRVFVTTSPRRRRWEYISSCLFVDHMGRYLPQETVSHAEGIRNEAKSDGADIGVFFFFQKTMVLLDRFFLRSLGTLPSVRPCLSCKDRILCCNAWMCSWVSGKVQRWLRSTRKPPTPVRFPGCSSECNVGSAA